MPTSIRREIHYRGTVQGVGFRYTVCQIVREQEASGVGVTGFVQNLRDGRVQLVVEGGKEQVDKLLNSITERMADYISEVESESATATDEFMRFEIRHER